MERVEILKSNSYNYCLNLDKTTEYEFEYTSIAKPNLEVISDDKVINKKTITVCYDYPFRNGSFYATYKSDDGFSIRDIVRLICQTYRQIYEEEKETSEIKPGNHPVLEWNRNDTNGKYGIWGHSIDELYFCDFTLIDDKNIIHRSR